MKCQSEHMYDFLSQITDTVVDRPAESKQQTRYCKLVKSVHIY